MNKGIILIGIITIISLSNLTDCVEENIVEFETTIKGAYCGHNESGNYVIKNESDWENLWDTVYSHKTPKPSLPKIDFTQHMVIAVFMGEKSSGGYNIEIVKVKEKNNIFEVYIEEHTPAPWTVVTEVFTQPFHIIKMRLIDTDAKFVTTEKIIF